MFPGEIQKVISLYKILGVIPLDKTLHVIFGAIITILLRWKGVGFKNIALTLGGLCTIKELIDFQTIGSTFKEGVFDTLFSYLYLCLLVLIRGLKKRLEEKVDTSHPNDSSR